MPKIDLSPNEAMGLRVRRIGELVGKERLGVFQLDAACDLLERLRIGKELVLYGDDLGAVNAQQSDRQALREGGRKSRRR
jgi:hypothetical protein